MASITVLYNDDSALAHGSAQDAIAVLAVKDCARAIAEALTSRGHRATAVGVPPEREGVLRAVAAVRDELVFNLVEGLGGDSRFEQAMAWLYELHGVRYTGSGPRAMALCMEKPVTKAVLEAAGLPVPRGTVLARGDESVAGLRFPLMVKPAREDASHGISIDSLVRDEAALRAQARRMIDTYAQPALVEEYIPAREINVALLGGSRGVEVLPLSEIDYSLFASDEPHLVTYAGKWIEDSRDWDLTKVIAARDLAPAQSARIESVARGAFETLELRDYARVDLRLDERGEPFIIDVNPNPDISPGAGFHLAAERAGLSYSELVERVVHSALSRHGEVA
ncbi:MAG: ATP-grasp domain-containing protein [Planctomycetes bacterium]|nr:ATP-grasp domain-containing protein [Planctomycetota bacterium]